jgi:hypothetical protein
MKALFLETFPVFLLSRILCISLIALSCLVTWETVPAREGVNHHPHIRFSQSQLSANLKRVWKSADASWYLGIAENGYHKTKYTSEKAHNWVFFPLYPLLTKFVSFALGSYLLSALLLSNVCFFFSLCAIAQLAKLRGYSEKKRQSLLALLAFFPSSYFLSSAITESLFLLLSLLAFYELEKGRLKHSSVWMLGACLTRPTGLLLLPAFGIGIWLKGHLENKLNILWFLLPLGGVTSFAIYLYSICGNPLAFSDNQNAWGRSTGGGLWLPDLQQLLSWSTPWNFSLLNAISATAGLLAAVYLMKQRRVTWALILAVPLAIALSTGTLQSITRFLMILFPIHFVLVDFVHESKLETYIIAIYAALLGVLSVCYGAHVTIAMA